MIDNDACHSIVTSSDMLERESSREKTLEKRAADLQRRAKATGGGGGRGGGASDSKDEKMEEVLRKVRPQCILRLHWFPIPLSLVFVQVDAEFLSMIKDAEEEETRDAEPSRA